MSIKPIDLVADGKSFLASDGSGTTWSKLLGPSFGVKPEEVEASQIQTSRNWVLESSAIMDNYGTVILLDSTARRVLPNGMNTVKYLNSIGVRTLVKSDGGLIPFHGGHPEDQLGTVRNGLHKFVAEMHRLGIDGSKCRTATTMNASPALLKASGLTQAQNAAAWNSAGLIAGIEPEVVGKHESNIEVHKKAALDALEEVFSACESSGVDYSMSYAKIGFVGNGQLMDHSSPLEVAEATLGLMHARIPEEIPLVVLLSGGWEPAKYYTYLSALVKKAEETNAPWTIRASASRAAFQCGYKMWGGKFENINDAIKVMHLRGAACMAACKGEYTYEGHEAPIEEMISS